MNKFLANRWIQAGLVLLILGSCPLFTIIFLAGVGLWPDPDPNPIGPGLLFFFTFWPSIICLGIGVFQAGRK